MSEAQNQPQQATNVPAQQPEKQQRKKNTGYRVQEEKIIEINKSHTNRREKARVMQLITIGLFGRRRYKNIYLVSSLNNFYPAIMIANTLQKKVEKLALVIRMDKVKYTEFAEEEAQGVPKQYSIFTIKITREPTEEDKQHPGFNAGLQKIQNPLTEIRQGKDKRKGDRKKPGDRQRRNQTRREADKREGREDNRRQERDTFQKRRTERRYEQKNHETVRRRPQRETRNQQRQENRETKDDRDNKRDNNDRRTQQRRGDRNYGREERRAPQRRDDEEYDRRPRKYRQNKDQRVEQDNNYRKADKKVEDNSNYRRGEKKTRGGARNEAGRVAEHGYNPAHMNRSTREQEDRQDRAPKRGRKDRYESDEDY